MDEAVRRLRVQEAVRFAGERAYFDCLPECDAQARTGQADCGCHDSG